MHPLPVMHFIGEDKMTELRVKRCPAIQMEMRVPGDKSISHRAVMFSAMTNGTCVIRRFLPSEDCMRTVEAMRALGIEIEMPEPTTLVVHGKRGKFTPPERDIECGNSGTTMRLLSGILAAQPFKSRLTGDASLSRRPMRRIISPLEQMGAKITAEGEGDCAPLVIEGGTLQPITYELPVASAQVKSAILLAGLFTKGKTTVIEPGQSRDHTERMLNYYLVALQKQGLSVSIHGGQTLESRDFTVPGDISSAAFWLVAAAAQPGARLLVEDVGLNDTRTGILGVLIRMGATVREIIEDFDQVERMGSVEVNGVRLKGTVIQGEEIPNLIDELPILAVAGALAQGTTIIRDAAELRVKETDRIAAMAENLGKMGAEITATEDGLIIEGGRPLHGAVLSSYGDHRIAMACAIAGLFAQGETVILDADCVDTSYPGFGKVLKAVMDPQESDTTPVIYNLHPKGDEE
jgi:3-phosphoshikimate 1-carboxyvinyltransferase